MKITHTEDYAKLRKNEYPSIEEQLESIWELLPASVSAESPVFQKIQAIKSKYPKPTAKE